MTPKVSRFSPTLFSRSFIVLHFTFRSTIHFELVFVKSVKSVTEFIILHVAGQVFRHHMLKRLSLLHCTAFVPLSTIR